MASPNGNHEYKDNKRNINTPSTTSAIERKMLEYMATQTQTLQAMTQTIVNIHQYIIEQASNLKNSNLVLGETVRFQLFHRHWIKKIYQSWKLKYYKDKSRPTHHPLITQR
jgi:DNA-binding transcriptional regulator/RsmH inhibitor MraZ